MFSTLRKSIPSLGRRVGRNTSFKAPVRDVKFLFNEILDVYKYFPEEATPDVVEMIISECAKFSENTLHPVWAVGDNGCSYDGNDVKTPPGWKEAYAKYVEGGWAALPAPAEFGGQGFPLTVDAVKTEFCATANWTWFMYPMLGHGAVECMLAYAQPDVKARFLPKLISGEWTGTMCLTEPHAGSDLGTVKTTAKPMGDGSYSISGTKIFISCGEHDWSPNIIHLVLARLPGAPAGTKGISLFVVPKYLEKKDGTFETKKNVLCAGIEHKMGIKGSATCVMSFENSIGWLVGQANNGMKEMFAFMNTARLVVGTQGYTAAELSYQNALPYAKERLSGRAPSGATHPDKTADPIISHPDVRRMLLKMKSFAEGARALVYHGSLVEDRARWEKDAKKKHALEEELALLTPIIKAFLTEMGFEAANDGIQVYGGHGFIKEWGMEQIVRDTRISQLYEGTTGIQSMDLLGRKVVMNKGKALMAFCSTILAFCGKNMGNVQMLPHTLALMKAVNQWMEISVKIMMGVQKDPNMLQSCAVDYMFFSGYVTLAYFWLRMEEASYRRLATSPAPADPEFYKAKIQTAEFYFERMLPKTQGYAATMFAPSKVLTQMHPDHFSFL